MKFDVLCKQLVAELFNTKSAIDNWNWVDNAWRAFIPGPNDINYMVNLVHFWDINLPHSFFEEENPLPPLIAKQLEKQASHSWVLEFGADEGDTTGITGEQGMSASKVFSMVGNAVIQKFKSDPNSFKNLAFEAKEPSRRELYRRLAPVIAKKLGLTVTSLTDDEDGEWFFLMSPNKTRIG